MVFSAAKMTAEQFLDLGEDPVGVRLELVEGQVAIFPSQTPHHSRAVMKLILALAGHIESGQMGELFPSINTILDPYTVRRPDLLFVAKSRRHLIGKKAMEGPTDLAIEVISPSSERIDLVDKFGQYRDARIENYWIVDPEARTIESWRLEQGAYVSTGSGRKNEVVNLPPFADLQIPLARLWRE